MREEGVIQTGGRKIEVQALPRSQEETHHGPEFQKRTFRTSCTYSCSEQEREIDFIPDSGASMHVLSNSDLTPGDQLLEHLKNLAYS